MRILIFSRTFFPAIGGLEAMAWMLAEEFAALGHGVEVLTDTPTAPEGEPPGTPFRITRTTALAGRWRRFRRAEVALLMNVSLHGLIAGWLAGCPLVASHQSCYEGRGPIGRLLEALKRLSMRTMANIACSAYVARQLPVPCRVVANAYDAHRFGAAPPSHSPEADFVFCGRLVSDKGLEVALRALALLPPLDPPATLTVIGEGPEGEPCRRLAEELGLGPRVGFLGSLRGPALAEALRRHACLLAPSLWEEPFGIVALEGLACCPTVIVAKRGGLPEAVGPFGQVVEPTPEAFAAAMEAVARARRSGAPLPGQGDPAGRREHLARHEPAAVARGYLEVLQAAARHRPSPR